jgi:UPF0755 protein
MSKKRGPKPISFIIILLLLTLGLGAWLVLGPNTGSLNEGEYLYIHTGATYENLLQELEKGGYVKNMWSFKTLADRANLPTHVHPGKYHIFPGMSNYAMVRMLHAGRQTPVKLVINKLRTKQDFISLLGRNLEADSITLRQLFHNPAYLDSFGLDTNTVMCGVMPDTYDFYWNTGADKAFRKIVQNYQHYWTPERQKQAKDQGLTDNEAIVIASIVDEETNKNDEKPKVASVYLNRLHNGMKLQADPTVKFAVGDFSIRRITGAHLQTVSPYNTYMYSGLPPGPICTPAPSSIQAVLTAPKTQYLYFCAKEDFSGYHNFAATYDEQLKNAHAYQQALDARGIH